jgi:hypothetical protein
MRFFVLCDFRILLQREANFIESFQQNVLPELIDLKAVALPTEVGDRLRGQIDGQGISCLAIRSTK